MISPQFIIFMNFGNAHSRSKSRLELTLTWIIWMCKV